MKPLSELAAEATPGPWKVAHAGNMHYGVQTDTGGPYERTIAHAHCDHDGYGNGSTRPNAEYIAAVPPEVVLGLLDARRMLGDLIDALHDEVRYEVGQSAHVLNEIEDACRHLGGAYESYIGEWL